MKKTSVSNQGFSLIGVILFIAIVGVFLWGMNSLFDPLNWFHKRDDARRKADLVQVQKALETYYKNRGFYPKSSGPSDKSCDGVSFLIKEFVPIKDGVAPINWGEAWVQYLDPLPKDPDKNKCYVYAATTDGQAYWLYASLDTGASDPDACNKGDACNNLTVNNIAPKQCGGICNYGITSSNVSP
jgi:Tfp pilus assembly protein PilE